MILMDSKIKTLDYLARRYRHSAAVLPRYFEVLARRTGSIIEQLIYQTNIFIQNAW